MVALMLSLAVCVAGAVTGTGVAMAAGDDKIVLRAERDLYGFFAQQAMIFEGKRVVYSRNSNFLCEPDVEVKLGVFSAPYDTALRSSRALLHQSVVRLVAPRPSPGGPHDLKLHLDKMEVTGDSSDAVTVRRVLEGGCELSGLVAERAVAVSLDPAKRPSRIRIARLGKGAKRPYFVSLEKSCKKQQDRAWECNIENFGKAFLRAEEPPGHSRSAR